MCAPATQWQLTGVNILGSPDRAVVCTSYIATGGACVSSTVFSGGYATGPVGGWYLVKDNATMPVFMSASYSVDEFTSRANGSLEITGTAKIR
jgi:hypothetical protein